MSDPAVPVSGSCRTCGGDLVQVPGVRTYHPAATSDPANPCPALMPIACGCSHPDGRRCLSFDVPDTEFVPAVPVSEPEAKGLLTEADLEQIALACDAMFDFGDTWVRFLREGNETVLLPVIESILAAHTPEGAEGEREVDPAQRHRDALADTGDAYTSFHGWVLDCSWCDYEAVGKTKAEALRHMQQHYHLVLPEGADIR